MTKTQYEEIILNRAWKRLHKKNEHFMLCLVGEEGSGKSMTAIRIAQELDDDFQADRVIFDVEELLRRLKNDQFEAGQAFVLDEAGVSLGRRTWQDRAQVLANQALQLIRSHNLALIFTLPALGELDSQAVSRLQAYYEIKQKVEGEYVKGPWYYIKTDRSAEGRGNYTPKPRIKHTGKPDERVDFLKFTPPDDSIIDEYLERKEQHQKETYDDAIEALSDDDSEDEVVTLTPKEVVDKIKDENQLTKVVSYHNGHHKWQFDKDLIRANFEVTHEVAQTAKKMLSSDPALDPAVAGAQREGEASANV